MTAISQVFQYETADVRTVMIGETEWVVGKDICAAIGISKYRDALAQLDTDERVSAAVDTPGGGQQMVLVNESGMYALMLISRSAKVKPFRKWVTAEVIPAIRKTGRYDTTPAPAFPPVAIAAQSEIDRANVARAQIEMLGVAVSTGLLDKLWATSKTHVIAARTIGEEPELPEALAPLYVPDFLKAKGLTAKEVNSVQSWFGRRAVEVGESNGADVPALRPTEQPNGSIRETRAWRREHLPLFETVWDTYYADKFARPMVLELGAA